MFGGNGKVVAWVQKHIDGRGYCPATAMAQDDNKLQSSAQVLHGVFQAAEHLRAETVTRHTDNEEVVWPLVENEFNRHTRIRTAEHSSERTLFR